MNDQATTHAANNHSSPSGPRQINRYRCMNRIGSNSNPFNKTPVSNRNYLQRYKLSEHKGGVSRNTFGPLAVRPPEPSGSREPKNFAFPCLPASLPPVRAKKNLPAVAANRDNTKFKNRRNSMQPNNIPKVNRDKNCTSCSPDFRLLPAKEEGR